MNKIVHTALKAVTAFTVLMLCVVTAHAETTNCTPITSLPYTINTQGVYCLTGHLSSNLAAGNAITINKNNVIIDLNGYKIGNLAAGNTTQANGIYAYQRQNITIKNGTIRGFNLGIWLRDDTFPYTTSQGHRIYGIRADMNYTMGMKVFGRGNTISNNTVVDTGGTVLTDSAFGIAVYGPGALVRNNTVHETKERSGGNAYGIMLSTSDGSVVWNNTIGNADLGSGTSTGIGVLSSDDVIVRDNHSTRLNKGIEYDGSTGKYMGNLTSGCDTAFSSGTDAGNNN